MTKTVSRVALALVLLSAWLSGDAHPQDVPSTCAPRAPDDAVAPTAESIAGLEGQLRVFAMDTVNMRSSWRGRSIQLRRPDSALVAEWSKRAAASGPGMRRERPPALIGVRAAGATPWWDESIVVTGATLELGACPLYFACMDLNTIYFGIERLSPVGAWGRWNDYQMGIGRLIDGRGQFLKDPAGYFCLLR